MMIRASPCTFAVFSSKSIAVQLRAYGSNVYNYGMEAADLIAVEQMQSDLNDLFEMCSHSHLSRSRGARLQRWQSQHRVDLVSSVALWRTPRSSRW